MSLQNFDPSLYESLLDQVEGAASAGGGLSNVSAWISKNTRDPANAARPFSFAGHQWQKDILNDTTPQVSVRKATQIGASEAFYRLALALCSKFNNINVMLVLPSIGFGQRIAMSRIDPIIAASPRLRDLASRDVSSNTLKKIGTSFLHIAGSATTSSAISVPARAILSDETDFSNPTVLATFASRLGHQEQSERILRYFSSPLFPGMGISALFEAGRQSEYLVYHSCGDWVYADPYFHLVLPGFDEPVYNLSPADLDNPRYRIDEAFIQCERCGQPITTENLADPARRAWVPRYPDREAASYSANPLVLAQLRTPQAILSDLRLYRSTTRFIQYSLGRGAESSSETLLQEVLDTCFVVPQVSPRTAAGVYGCVLGADIGKESNIVIGRSVGTGQQKRFEILWMQTLRQDGTNALGQGIAELFQKYNCVNAVIDAAPDVSIVKYLQTLLPYGQCHGAYFVRGRGRGNLESWEVNERDGTVKIARTRLIDQFVTDFNARKVTLPTGLPNEDSIKKQLSRLKRVVTPDSTGEEAVSWVSTDSNDHSFFSCLYGYLAAEMSQSSTSILPGLHLGNLIAKVKMPGGVGNPLGSGSGMGVGGVRGLGAGFGR